MHSRLQPRSKRQTEQPSGWEHMDNSYTVLAAMRPVTVICVVVPNMYYTVSGILYHKSTESMYTCTLDGV